MSDAERAFVVPCADLRWSAPLRWLRAGWRDLVRAPAVTLVFGVVDGLAAAGLGSWVPALFTQLPLADQSMGWLVPVLVMLVLAVVTDRLLGRAERVQHRA